MTRFAPLTALAMILAAPAAAQDAQMADVEITATQLTPGIAVLFGRGGNIGVSYGEDGTVLIDDQFAPLTARIQAAIADLGAEPVRFLINTHWHGDHSGGNENFGEAGALILAHENVRIRMAENGAEGRTVPAVALPVVTYEDGLKLHLNGDTVHVIHMHNGHTDGDSIIWWENANVVHMGDLFFNGGSFPYIDRDSGGAVQGVVQAATRVIDMTDAETRIIPGHGPMATRADLIAYRDMIGALMGQVESAIAAGRTLEEIQAMNFPADYADREGGFISGEQFIGFIYESLTDPQTMEHHHDHGSSHEDGDDIH
ncbi:MBL fold metallo-hydrolase [Parasphingopyxis marina]|uniref:beta-lactamase n=1 Tax=Parasphingopyxis marina TaxID=2761622 RepID=A0A842I0L2_9SPHN|nr:MBL fold metallo-hydrolase [Parasphingopyxis marina]MBC2778231.1 MBL fold metallo-hydrolase [Parasphingopyxis marina]